MRKRKKMILSIIAICIILLFIASAVLPAVLAADTNQQKIDSLKTQLEQLTKKQKELEKNINSVRVEQKTKTKQKEQLDDQIDVALGEIGVMNELVDEFGVQIAAKEQEVSKAQANIDSRNEIYLKRIRATYEEGQVSYIEVVLGSSNFSQFLNRLGMVEDIMNYDQNLISEFEGQKLVLQNAKATLEASQTEKKAVLEELQTKQTNLEKKYDQTAVLIKQLEQDEKEYAKAYEAAEAAQDKLNAQVTKLLAEQKKTTYVGGDFTWPLPGYTKISSYFGMRMHPVLKVKKLHTGVDIPAPSGTKILAANSGKVISQGYNAGYGNYIIIDHGGGMATLYGHMKKPAMYKQGAKVTKGAQIGMVGTTGYSTGNHLHFEIRKNGTAVDPMTYFKKQ